MKPYTVLEAYFWDTTRLLFFRHCHSLSLSTDNIIHFIFSLLLLLLSKNRREGFFLLQLLELSTLNILCLQTKEAFLCPRLSRNSPNVATTNTHSVTRKKQCRGRENGYFIYEVQVFALIMN